MISNISASVKSSISWFIVLANFMLFCHSKVTVNLTLHEWKPMYSFEITPIGVNKQYTAHVFRYLKLNTKWTNGQLMSVAFINISRLAYTLYILGGL